MGKSTIGILVLLLAAGRLSAQCNGSPAQCLGTQSYTANPAPVNGLYNSGTTVTFCYTIQNYNQCNSNWLHTINITLGPGWDASTLTAVSVPNSCDGQGNWGLYSSTTSTNTGITYGPCFAYDSPLGNPSAVLDGIPGNNFGDNCTNYTWTFCFSVEVAPGCSNQSLNVSATAIGDGSGGSWTSNTCPGVPFTICTAECAACPMDVAGTVTNPSCLDNDGSITLAIDSAIGPVTYLWEPGGQLTQDVSNLSSGTYNVQVVDSVGCVVLDTFTLGFINPVELNTFKTDANCYGYCDGTVFIIPQGGTNPYTYNWNTGGTTSSDTALCAGTYYVTVADADACTRIDTIVINQPAQIVLTPSHTDATCFALPNGTAAIGAVGGAGNYSYSWMPSSQHTPTAINLLAGAYTVVVTDASGCFADTTITILSPPQILSNAVLTDPSCHGFSDGAITANASQGVTPYQYLWLSSGNTLPTLSNIPVGKYVLLITDANGCTEQDTFQLIEPDELFGLLDIKPASCMAASDGSISTEMVGGTLPYFYMWNNDPTKVASALFDLPPGADSVLITDAHNCVFEVRGDVPALAELVVDAGFDTAIELGTHATLHATVSRKGEFNWAWTPDYNLTDSLKQVTTAYPYFTTTYTATATEVSSGCKGNDSMTVKILPTDYVIFPTAFTPNGDGLNDVFLPVAGNLVTIESFKIFNRWGNMVFDDNTKGWDGMVNGKPEEMGTYVYEVSYKIEGRDNTYYQKGSVILLR